MLKSYYYKKDIDKNSIPYYSYSEYKINIFKIIYRKKDTSFSNHLIH